MTKTDVQIMKFLQHLGSYCGSNIIYKDIGWDHAYYIQIAEQVPEVTVDNWLDDLGSPRWLPRQGNMYFCDWTQCAVTSGGLVVSIMRSQNKHIHNLTNIAFSIMRPTYFEQHLVINSKEPEHVVGRVARTLNLMRRQYLHD